jgi:hypothetical protein
VKFISPQRMTVGPGAEFQLFVASTEAALRVLEAEGVDRLKIYRCSRRRVLLSRRQWQLLADFQALVRDHGWCGTKHWPTLPLYRAQHSLLIPPAFEGAICLLREEAAHRRSREVMRPGPLFN